MSRANLWTVFVAQCKASPCKSGVLGVLTVGLVVLVGRQLLPGPSPAEAALPPGLAAVAAVAMPARNAARARRQRPPLPNLPDTLSGDLFEPDWSAYTPAPWAGAGGGEPRALAPAESAEAETRDAPELVLELTLTEPSEGGRPYAVINGKTVRVGDAIGGLVVESIAPGAVVLTAGGNERIALGMD